MHRHVAWIHKNVSQSMSLIIWVCKVTKALKSMQWNKKCRIYLQKYGKAEV